MTADDDLRQRFTDLGAGQPGRGGGVTAIRARADRRRRTRMTVATLGMVAVVGLAAFGVASFDDGGTDDRERLTAAQPDDGAPDGAVSPDGSSTTVPAPTPTTTTPEPVAAGTVVVDQAPTVTVHAADGSELARFEPYPDRSNTRAVGFAGQVVVLAPDGTEVTVYDVATGDGRVVPLDPVVDSDVWTVGRVDGAVTLVHAELAVDGSSSTLRAHDLDRGGSRALATDVGGSFGQPSVTADGRVISSLLGADMSCDVVAVTADGTLERSPLSGCELVEPVVSPDGTSVFDADDTGLVRYDLATGVETGRWDTGPVQAEGLQLDVGDTVVLLGNAYVDDEHGPFVAVDTTTGAITELAVRGAASHLD